MGSISVSPFRVLDDTRPDDTTLPPFMVSTTRGFLPRADPVIELPPEFAPLESLLRRMPVKTASGEPGLLARFQLGPEVDAHLPDLTAEMDRYRDNLPVMNALYRDYSFLASAYLLEPCHERFVRGEEYGLGRQRLPRQISLPIARCAEISGFQPFMEYAGSYALYNYRLVDPAKGLEYDNLRLIRAFEHGLHPESSEAGFVLVHIDMVRHSGPLVAGVLKSLDAAATSSATAGGATKSAAQLREGLNAGLEDCVGALGKINAVMETMWGKSRPTEYTSFRTFIFGITSQSMFPSGVVYEGVNGDRPLDFRGESGANDSMVPLMDNLLQVPMPDTPLTEILRDFRRYRPSNHRAFLEHVGERSRELDLRAYALGLGRSGGAGTDDGEADLLRASRSLWLQVLNQVRDFRWRHWCFAREYILKRTAHPTATGGSPIVTWLPNQLFAILDEMQVIHQLGAEGGGLGRVADDVMEAARRQRDTLQKEVDKFCSERGVKRC